MRGTRAEARLIGLGVKAAQLWHYSGGFSRRLDNTPVDNGRVAAGRCRNAIAGRFTADVRRDAG
jgi:hypothetical protein